MHIYFITLRILLHNTFSFDLRQIFSVSETQKYSILIMEGNSIKTDTLSM